MKNLTRAALLGTLVFVYPVCSAQELDSVSLGYRSRAEVVLAALGGGIGGLGSYMGLHFLSQLQFPKLSQHPYAASFFAVAGAITAGIWKYQYTPESHFNFARSNLLKIAQNPLFNVVLSAEQDKVVSVLKDHYFREKFPLYAAFKHLYKICALVDQSKDSLASVLASSRQDLHQESVELQLLADMYLGLLKEIFKTLKEDQNFINEFNAGTMDLIKEAQEAAAQAAQSSAFTQQMAYMSSLHHPRNV